MTVTRRLALTMSMGVGLVAAETAGAEPGRALDLQGGFTYTQSVGDDVSSLPGLAFELRHHRRAGLWLSAALAVDPAIDLSNPEEGELRAVFAAGAGGGASVEVGGRLSLHGGVRADVLAGGGALGSARFGPTASARAVLGHPYGHPMGIELRGTWFRYAIDGGDDRWRWQLGLLITGTLSAR